MLIQHNKLSNSVICFGFLTLALPLVSFQRGNTIRYNHIHHTLRLVPGADVRGVMLDDQSSGTIIKFNLFYDVRN